MFFKKSSHAVTPLETIPASSRSHCESLSGHAIHITTDQDDDTSACSKDNVTAITTGAALALVEKKNTVTTIINGNNPSAKTNITCCSSSSKKQNSSLMENPPSPDTTSYNSSSIPKPDNEDHRLEVLRNSQLLSLKSISEDLYPLCALARRNLKVPVAYFSFVDSTQIYLKSKLGMSVDVIPRYKSPCSYTICQGNNDMIFTVLDLLEDPRFSDITLPVSPTDVSLNVTPATSRRSNRNAQQFPLRFYAGVPVTLHGMNIGTFCIGDIIPRESALSERDSLILQDIAAIVSTLLREKELRTTSTTCSTDSAQFMISMMQSLKPALGQVSYHYDHLKKVMEEASSPPPHEITTPTGASIIEALSTTVNSSIPKSNHSLNVPDIETPTIGQDSTAQFEHKTLTTHNPISSSTENNSNQQKQRLLVQRFVDDLTIFQQALQYLSKEMERSLRLGYFSFRHIAPSTVDSIVATNAGVNSSSKHCKNEEINRREVDTNSLLLQSIPSNASSRDHQQRPQQQQQHGHQFEQYDLDTWLDELKKYISMPSYYIPNYHEVTWRMNYHSGMNSRIAEVNTEILALIVSLLLGRAMLRWKKLRVVIDVSFTALTLGVHDGVHSSTCRLYLRIIGSQAIHSRKRRHLCHLAVPQSTTALSSNIVGSAGSVKSDMIISSSKKVYPTLTTVALAAMNANLHQPVIPAPDGNCQSIRDEQGSSFPSFHQSSVETGVDGEETSIAANHSNSTSLHQSNPISCHTDAITVDACSASMKQSDSTILPSAEVIEDGVILRRRDQDKFKNSEGTTDQDSAHALDLYVDEELLLSRQSNHHDKFQTSSVVVKVATTTTVATIGPIVSQRSSINESSNNYLNHLYHRHQLIEHFLRDSQYDRINYALLQQCDLFVSRFILQGMRGGISHQWKEVDDNESSCGVSITNSAVRQQTKRLSPTGDSNNRSGRIASTIVANDHNQSQKQEIQDNISETASLATSNAATGMTTTTRIRGEEFSMWIPCKIHWNHGPMKDDEALLQEVYGLDSKLPMILMEQQQQKKKQREREEKREKKKLLDQYRGGKIVGGSIAGEREVGIIASIQETTSRSTDENRDDSYSQRSLPSPFESHHNQCSPFEAREGEISGKRESRSTTQSSFSSSVFTPSPFIVPGSSPFSVPLATADANATSASTGRMMMSQIINQVSKALSKVLSAKPASSSSNTSSVPRSSFSVKSNRVAAGTVDTTIAISNDVARLLPN